MRDIRVVVLAGVTAFWAVVVLGALLGLKDRADALELRLRVLEGRAPLTPLPTATVEWCDTLGQDAPRTWADLAPLGITPPPDAPEERPRAGRMRVW